MEVSYISLVFGSEQLLRVSLGKQKKTGETL